MFAAVVSKIAILKKVEQRHRPMQKRTRTTPDRIFLLFPRFARGIKVFKDPNGFSRIAGQQLQQKSVPNEGTHR